MHKIELILSLANLDEPTPTFFRDEALAGGDPTAGFYAREILESLGNDDATEVLKEIFRIV